ncbi:MAG: peptidoglycan glycosyltransferase [Euryarchaeota archaeon]|nr:peptidoglycan glycosyltransferase [Euryarchaeota archaeon]
MRNSDLKRRSLVFIAIVVLIACIFIAKLTHLQLISSEWSNYAGRLTEDRERLDPIRGQFLDRNGELLVTNIASYDLLITPRKAVDLDTLALAELIGWEVERLIEQLDKASNYSRYVASVLVKQLNYKEYAQISKELYQFPGIKARTRSIRSNVAGVAGHLIGEYREADQKDLNSDKFYSLGDYKGKSGLEARHEKDLRGVPGARYHIVDVRNNKREILADLDTMPISGSDITLTLDLGLQRFAEELMEGKRGSVVAIEPSTGEVLAIVSSPFYDADDLTGSRRGVVYDSLRTHPHKPLYNRALRGTYRPGSIFKMLQGLIALDEGVIYPHSVIECNREIIGCHGEHTADNLTQAITHSCNPYFREVMRRVVLRGKDENHLVDASIGLTNWNERVEDFGFGTDLGGNLPGTRKGQIPSSGYYDGIYGKTHWGYSTIYSISIGEGELLTTPLQMANLACIIANRGTYREPHAIRDLGGRGKPEGEDNLHETSVNPKHFDPVIDAMQLVIEDETGTARRARVEGIEICGKTGTVQNKGDLDHSAFIAFAPRENPKIALSVYVEYSGHGGTWSAPIAGLLIEKYLTDSIKYKHRLDRVLTFEVDEL